MMLDDPEALEIDENAVDPTLEKFTAAKGKEIPPDYFMYSCIEQMATQKAFAGKTYAGRYKPIVSYLAALDADARVAKEKESANLSDASQAKPTEKALERFPLTLDGIPSDLSKAIPELFQFYKSHYQEISTDKVLDHGAAAEILPSFALLLIDLEFLLANLSANGKIPVRSQTSPWPQIDEEFHNACPRYSSLIIKFLDWKYQAATATKLDLKSIPPVGRYNRLFLKGRIKKNSRDRGPSARDGARPSSAPQKTFGSSSRNRPDNTKNRTERPRNGDRPSKAPRNRQKEQERTNLVIKEAKSAIEKLRQSSDLTEIKLRPRNSYLRRIQHKHIVDAGFISTSVGEADDRAVKISKS